MGQVPVSRIDNSQGKDERVVCVEGRTTVSDPLCMNNTLFMLRFLFRNMNVYVTLVNACKICGPFFGFVMRPWRHHLQIISFHSLSPHALWTTQQEAAWREAGSEKPAPLCQFVVNFRDSCSVYLYWTCLLHTCMRIGTAHVVRLLLHTQDVVVRFTFSPFKVSYIIF